MIRTKRVLWASVSGMTLVLAGCEGGSLVGKSDSPRDNFLERPTVSAAAPQDAEAPNVFQVDEEGLWDGRPSLGGVWVAHPDATDPERVIIRNADNGREVVGALFRRERDNPGPRLQVSSDAAAALGLLAGAPTELAVTALRRTEPAAPEPVEAEVTLPIADDASETVAAATDTAQPGDIEPIPTSASAETDIEPPKKRGWGLFRKKKAAEPADATVALDAPEAVQTEVLAPASEGESVAAAALTVLSGASTAAASTASTTATTAASATSATTAALDETASLAQTSVDTTATATDAALIDANVVGQPAPEKRRWWPFKRKDAAVTEPASALAPEALQVQELSSAEETVSALASTSVDTSAPATDIVELVDGPSSSVLEDTALPKRQRRGFFGRRTASAAPASALNAEALGEAATAGAAVETAPLAPATEASLQTGAATYVRVGQFSLKSHAEAAAGRMRRQGIVPNVVETTDRGTTFWTVEAGPTNGPLEHVALLNKVKEMGFADAFTLRR